MAVTIRQEINIITTPIEAIASSNSNAVVQLDTTQYVNPTYYLEVVTSTLNTGTGTFTLRRNGTTTDDASITNTSLANVRLRSTAFTPPAGQTEYVVRNGRVTGTTGIKSARIIIIDSPTTLTSTETQIEIGMNKTGLVSTTATEVVPDTTLTKYWLYTAAKWDGTKTFYAEVTYAMASSKSSGTFVLQEDNGSFASWTDKVTIVNAGVATTTFPGTRVRSASFTPTDGRNYRIAYLVASSKSAASIFNAKVIVDQSSVVADSYSETNQDGSLGIDNGGTDKIGVGQSFAGNGGILTRVRFYINKFGSPTGNANAKIYAHSGVFGTSSAPTGAALAVSDNFDISTLTTTLALVNFTFSGANQITLTNATNYCVTIETTGGDGSNFIFVGRDGSSPTHGGNSMTQAPGGAWTADAVRDFCFYVLTANPTLLEPQYLLLNTGDAGTGLQNYQTLYDSTEWSGVTNTYKHAMDSDNALNAAKIEDTTTTTILTTSAVTGANQQISSDMVSQLVSTDTLDTDIITSTGVIAASRILVGVTVSAGGATLSISVSDSITLSEFNDQLRAGARDLAVSDTEAITDSVALREDSFISKSESVSLSESLLRMMEAVANVSDSAAITDSVLRRLDANPSVSDSLVITENAVEFVTPIFVNVSDSIAATDGVTLRQDSFISKSDSAAITDSVFMMLEAFASVSDSIAITDSVTKLLTAFLSVSDTAAITDSVILQELSFVAASDSETITDSLFMQELSFISASEPVSLSESNSELIPTLFLAVSDSMAVTDSATETLISFVSASDGLSLSEAQKLLLDANPSVSDSLAITDSVSRMLESFVSKSEAISLSEALARMLESYISTSDTETITDTSIELIPTLFITVSDSITITESTNVVEPGSGINVNDSLAISEAQTLLIPTLFLSVSDSLVITESVSGLVSVQITASDSAAVTDSVNALIPNLNLTASDSISLSETLSRTLESFISKAESLIATDSVSIAIPSLSLSVTDSLNLSESLNLLESVSINLADNLALSESSSVVIQVSLVALNLSVSDSVILSELLSLAKAYVSAHDSLENITVIGGIPSTGNSDAEPINQSGGAAVAGAGDTLENPTAGAAVNSSSGDSGESITHVGGSAASGHGDSLGTIDANSGSPASAGNDSGY